MARTTVDLIDFDLLLDERPQPTPYGHLRMGCVQVPVEMAFFVSGMTTDQGHVVTYTAWDTLKGEGDCCTYSMKHSSHSWVI